MINVGIKNGGQSSHSIRIGQIRLPALYQSAGCGVYQAPLIIAARMNETATAPKTAASTIGIYRHSEHSAPTHTMAISISVQRSENVAPIAFTQSRGCAKFDMVRQ